MMRSSASSQSSRSTGRASPPRINSKYQHKNHNKLPVVKYLAQFLVVTAGVWLVVVLHSHKKIVESNANNNNNHKNASRRTKTSDAAAPVLRPAAPVVNFSEKIERNADRKKKRARRAFPPAFVPVLVRAKEKRDYCREAQFQFSGFDDRYEVQFGKDNQTLATLPSFGVIKALEDWRSDARYKEPLDEWQCKLPYETECGETQLTAIFMAYNPDRLDKMFGQIKKMLSRDNFQGLIKECVIVWNGPREIDESEGGKELLRYASQPEHALRIVYPLKMGFPNDLMNRYHPHIVNVTTKGILYYDDDGPFYSYKAIEAGFELWKRNARAQIGAMSRKINYSARQQQEYETIVGDTPNDKQFISHCDNLKDEVEYNFYYFANYDANMVLPSGSMLHVNYLCFLWHPALAEIRKFVLDHPVHPDDITVSTVVSQIGGRAPKVYSRRLNPDETKNTALKAARRRLTEDVGSDKVELTKDAEKPKGAGIGGICWDCGQGMTEKKQIWADLRSQAINTLIRYFGSINSGSIGWCENTPYFDPKKKDGRCQPIMAKQGWLPWMNPDGSPKESCP